ncbi:hypothetical protein CWM66_07905 [Kosakonia sp. H7A]|nr:hypothetical protein CWM66_07905 [Kosakonia sp. H7A]
MLKAMAEMSVKYEKKEIEIAETAIRMVNEILDSRSIGRRELLSIYLYAFGCLEIYRTVALNGGFVASSLFGVDCIPSALSITRVICTEAYSSAFISLIEDKKKFECETDMMCSALFKTALSHYLSNHNTDFLFNNLRLQTSISIEEAEELERHMYLLNELMSCC